MAHIEIDDVGGIRAARRGLPWWLVVFAVAMLSIASWYLLSFSSTAYDGGFPKPDPVVAEAAGGAGGH